MEGDIANRWRLLSGQDNWKNLLDPLDMDLRRYLIHYGELAQATYDTFNSERQSEHAGDSYFSKEHLFCRVGLKKANPFKYNPTKYIYATSQIPVAECFMVTSLAKQPWAKDTNWIGFVAVASDEAKALLGRRDIVVAWRGTIQAFEWITDFNFPLTSAAPLFGEESSAKIHRGWLSFYTSENADSQYAKTSAREQVLTELKRLLEEFKDEEISITVTGHSLGAALAAISAADIGVNGFNKLEEQPDKECPVTAFPFACPHVGDENFRNLVNSKEDLHILLIRNAPDIVPLVPVTGYSTVGEELLIDTTKSKYLKRPGNAALWHALEGYLHGVAGTHGEDGEFKLVIKRDIGLINKMVDALKDEYLIPSTWWCLENKGMVQLKNGRWKLRDHEKDADEP